MIVMVTWWGGDGGGHMVGCDGGGYMVGWWDGSGHMVGW